MTPTEKQHVRQAIKDYCLRSEKSRGIIHYSQIRPYTCLGDIPEKGFTADCSSFTTAALFWPQKTLGIPMRDPNGRAWDGWGYTGTLLNENLHHSIPADHPILVGDFAIYGPAYATRHVVICRTGGYRHSAIFTSHGSENGPLPVRVTYRGDLLGIFRPKSLL